MTVRGFVPWRPRGMPISFATVLNSSPSLMGGRFFGCSSLLARSANRGRACCPECYFRHVFLKVTRRSQRREKKNLTTQASQEAIRKMASRCLWLTRLEFRVLQPLQRKRRGFDLCTDSNEAPRPWHRSWRCRGNADRRTRSILVPRRHASKIEVFFFRKGGTQKSPLSGRVCVFFRPFFYGQFSNFETPAPN